MKLSPLVQRCGVVLLITAALVPLSATPQSQPSNLAAGKISALIPVGSVLRERKVQEAKKEMAVLWEDTVLTGRGGRARVQLEDGSILNVGSQASLVIHKHDPGKQQTQLELIYGKVRASATKIASPEGKFEMRTKVAVCGIVGTEEYVEATDVLTTVVALGGGQVAVSSTDTRFSGTTFLDPGETITLIAGRPPGLKRTATPEELLKVVEDTEVDSQATLDPNHTIAGRSLKATITGKALKNTQELSFNHPGLKVQPRGEVTAKEIPVTITVGADVPVGTYTLTIQRPEGPVRAPLVVTTQDMLDRARVAAASAIQPTASQSLSGIRGAKIPIDASGARTPPGTEIVSYQWSVANTTLSSSGPLFTLNTSLLVPGSYTIQLTMLNSGGQAATQQYPLSVEAGTQPAEIVRDLASAYESLQPAQFLKNLDEQKFRNYSGFAAAIEESFRDKLESMRVFQRPVNCAVVEEQDQAACQAEFELQFTRKDQSSELLDAQGNPIPAGVTPPPDARLGKRILKGSERATIRFERSNVGWKVVDYATVVSCPSGAGTTGVNVGSCILALGSAAAPSFQIVNLQTFSTDLTLGGSVGGSFTVVPIGGFTGPITFTGEGQIGNQSVTVQFGPNPSGPTATVNFTVFSPETAPTGFSAARPFPLVITGRDSSGGVTATANTTLVLQPDFSLQVKPDTTSSAPAQVSRGGTLQLSVQVVSSGSGGAVLIDFPNLPMGFGVEPSSGNVALGVSGSFLVRIGSTAALGPAFIVVRGIAGSGLAKTATVFVDVRSGNNPVPTITTISPSGTGVSSPAFTLTVNGTNYLINSVVSFGGVARTTTFVSATQLTAAIPANAVVAAGPRAMTVTNPALGGGTSIAVTFTVFPIGIPSGSGLSALSLTPRPTTSASAPVLLSPDSSTKNFTEIEVHAGEGFAGLVKLNLRNLPNGVNATLVPEVVDLSASPLQVVQLHFQTAPGAATFAPTGIVVAAASDSLHAETTVFIAAQAGTALPGTESAAGAQPPRVLQVRDPGGVPGAYAPVTIFGESLGTITGVLSDNPRLSATLEPGGSNTQIQLSVFVKPRTPPGAYGFLLTGPRGTVPIPFTVKPAEIEVEEDRPASPAREARSLAKSGVFPERKPLEGDTELPAASNSRTAVSGVVPAILKPGDVAEGKLFGRNLTSVTAVRVSGNDLSVEVLEAKPSELRVRFTVGEAADPGSRLLTVEGGGNKVNTTIEVAPQPKRLAAISPRRARARADDSADAGASLENPGDKPASTGLPELVVHAEDFTMKPVNPVPGDTVNFSVRVRNAGARRIEDAAIEFSISGTTVRQREQVSLEPGASQTLDFEWKAAGTGRFEPRVAIDPENRIPQQTRANKTAALLPFQLDNGKGPLVGARRDGFSGDAAEPSQRGQLHLTGGECVGFRLASGAEQTCGSGADFEIHSAPDGSTLVIQAEGVSHLGSVPLDHVTAASSEALPTSDTVVAGVTYLVRTRRSIVAVRVAQVSRQGHARGAPPAALRGPRLRKGGDEPTEIEAEAPSSLTILLEWRFLPQ